MSRRLCNTSTPGEGFDLAVETELQNLESRPGICVSNYDLFKCHWQLTKSSEA